MGSEFRKDHIADICFPVPGLYACEVMVKSMPITQAALYGVSGFGQQENRVRRNKKWLKENREKYVKLSDEAKALPVHLTNIKEIPDVGKEELPEGFEYHNGNGTVCLIGDFDEEADTFTEQQDQAVDYGRAGCFCVIIYKESEKC